MFEEKKKRLKIRIGSNRIDFNQEVKESSINSTNTDKKGKHRVKVGGVPVKSGNAYFLLNMKVNTYLKKMVV